MNFPESLSGSLVERRQAFADRFDVLAGSVNNDPAVYPLLFSIAAGLAESDQPVSLSVAGSQGSGKTTMSYLLKALLEQCFSKKVAVLSLDDFYLSRAARQELATSVHPLLATRGVPGTHDAAAMDQALKTLLSGGSVEIPRFDKAADDRAPDTVSVNAVDVVICEGWCWGALPQNEDQLLEPINDLERIDDPDGQWRSYVNDCLKGYQSLFATDASVYYLAPSMEAVFRWRLQQEQELRQRQRDGDQLMDEIQIRRFISFYERLTRWMMEILPSRVDVCVRLGEDHHIETVNRRS